MDAVRRFCQPRRHVVWAAKEELVRFQLAAWAGVSIYVVPPDFSWVRVMRRSRTLAAPHSRHPLADEPCCEECSWAAFFESCTSNKVANNTHIVLIDLATNLFGALEQLVLRLREVAPHAVVALVLGQEIECSLAHANIFHERSWQRNADVMRADAILMRMTGRHGPAVRHLARP